MIFINPMFKQGSSVNRPPNSYLFLGWEGKTKVWPRRSPQIAIVMYIRINEDKNHKNTQNQSLVSFFFFFCPFNSGLLLICRVLTGSVNIGAMLSHLHSCCHLRTAYSQHTGFTLIPHNPLSFQPSLFPWALVNPAWTCHLTWSTWLSLRIPCLQSRQLSFLALLSPRLLLACMLQFSS